MGFLGNIFSAGVKTVLTPIVVVKDIVSDDDNYTTSDHVEDIIDDIEEGCEDLGEGDLL